jgi:dUTP pyrophosphatase
MKMQVQIVKNTLNALPTYGTPEAAGCDLRAELSLVNDKFLYNAQRGTSDGKTMMIVINPGGRALIPTGLHIALPVGYEAQIRPRSGLALKSGITVLNTPGTIDSDYRGDVGVILINHGTEPFCVMQGDRIAQMVITKAEQVDFIQVNELNETDRGTGGFGSTGSN